MKNKKIVIIGSGNMGESILNGLVSNKTLQLLILLLPEEISNIRLPTHIGVNLTDDNIKAINYSEIIIKGLKPYNILTVLKS